MDRNWSNGSIYGCSFNLSWIFTHSIARTPQKASPLQQKGAIIVDSPSDVSEKSDIVFTMGVTGGEGKDAVVLPGAALSKQLFSSMVANGDGNMGTQGLITVIERINGKSV
ncbi:hypothetical protein C5167_004871 [Papaver somniferum]|uniref:6-phosphogluconate dehydrogenase NADP-binding domain-containing protein n=1 Tax=Papaver somniferum TaxID=3469 RepID=A0A4Y7JC35_PAPSO|nr:hypothetical protein C5167_004871 [Papaver somniferum]